MKQKIMVKEIARKAGVSNTTVLNVMHGRKDKVSAETFDKIEGIVNEYGCHLNLRASLLAGRKNMLVAVLDFGQMEEEFAEEQRYCELRTLTKKIYENGQYALIHFPKDMEEGIIYAKTWGADGIVTLGLSEKKAEMIADACSCRSEIGEKLINVNR